MANYFGIDFGTTNSAIVMVPVNNGVQGSIVRFGEDERHPLPSFVAINKTSGEVKTGLDAKKSISNSEEYVIYSSIKTIIDNDQTWEIAGKQWSQIDIAAELFKALKNKVYENTSGKISLDKAVVAVPVGFTSKKKNSLRKAAQLAGITISMFISEPTAAYCSKMNQLRKCKNIAVFDWGGGTLDIVVLKITNNECIQEMATEGMTLAGNDIDRKIAEKICLNVATKTNQDFSFDDLSSGYRLNLLNLCEQAKCTLADDDVATVTVSKLDRFGRALERIQYSYFSELIENEVESAIDCLLKALSNAGMNKESIDCILCEGGSSRLRPLQERMVEYFGRDKLVFPMTAMWDIATGAAMVASKPGSYALSKPIGVLQANNVFYPLLKAGQRIPTEEKHLKFGITESTSEARFVFTDGETDEKQTFMEYFPVKLRGFSDEVIDASCYVDADMVFKIKISSNRMPDNVFRVWTYSNLKVVYKLASADSKPRSAE